MGVHCKLTELGKTTMAVKSLTVILSLSSLGAAEPSYGYGVGIHPTGVVKTDRSPQGAPGYGIVSLYGKREVEPSYGYGVAIHPTGISKTDRSPQGLGYGLYGKRSAEPGYGYGGYGAASVSVSQFDHGYGYNPQSYTYGYNIGGYGKRSADPGYGIGLIGYGLAATAFHPYGGVSSTDRSPQYFQPMAMEFMEREMLMLSLAMELVMDLLPLPSIHMEDPAPTTEPHKDFPVMDITSTMFMVRDLLNLDIFMESITVNNMSVNHILAMQSMLPILIEFCKSLRLYLIISLICENNLNRIKN